eukprot:TRINITY_DN435_c0_g1_i1.p1 TRINITY_DN435_c0_g1~~TRINITY_DN435_c0_g1_i1.p1  ORF type:complete len:1502 (+),score=362.71 TRINITY_DN435_c0_g1_i1:242-4507(+)
MPALMHLCEVLSMAQEDSLGGFRIDQFVPILLNIIEMGIDPTMMLYACRALTNLVVAAPGCAGALLGHGAAKVLCERLLTLEYIDVAEQCIKALEKLAHEHPTAVLEAGGLAVVLTKYDFFSPPVQRESIAAAASMCHAVPPELFDEHVVSVMPNLIMLLKSRDEKLVEGGYACLSQLVESLHTDEAKLRALASDDLLTLTLATLSGPVSLSPSVYDNVLRMLSRLCLASPHVARILLDKNLPGVLGGMLAATSTASSKSPALSAISSVTSPSRALAACGSPQHVSEIIALADALFPCLPRDLEMPFLMSSVTFFSVVARRYRRGAGAGAPEAPRPLPRVGSPGEEARRHTMERVYNGNSQLLLRVAQALLPAVSTVFTSSNTRMVRLQCLSIINKIVHFATVDVLPQLLENTFASFIAELIASEDDPVIAWVGLAIAESLLQKLPPEVAVPTFLRAGVFFEMEKMTAARAASTVATDATSSPSPPPSFERRDMARPLVIKYASRLLHTHCTDMDPSGSSQFKQLKPLCGQLRAAAQGSLAEDAENACLAALNGLLTAPEGVSTFELLKSTLISDLISYLTSPPTDQAPLCPLALERVLLCRARRFITAFFGDPSRGAADDANVDRECGLVRLVRRLHDLLNKCERFGVALHEVGGAGSAQAAACLKLLTQPFKLQFKRDDSDTTLEDIGIANVLVEPLATIQSVFDWLSQRVSPRPKKAATPPAEGGGPARAASPQAKRQRTVAARRTSARVRVQDEGEEQGAVAVEPSAETITATGGASGSLSSPRLVLRLFGHALPRSGSVVAALQWRLFADSAADASASVPQSPRQAHRLWEQRHELTYSAAKDDQDVYDNEERDDGLPKLMSVESKPLGYFLAHFVPPPVGTRGVEDVARSALSLLSVLYVISEEAHTLFKMMGGNMLVSPAEFVSQKLSSKLLRQLQDPFSVCSGALPHWCGTLCARCRFLFPLDLRLLYFQCTSFGIARALHCLHDKAQESGRQFGDFKLGRIPRLKVRVARSRVLESAMKVMELGTYRSVLEVEYFGEPGSGLGPTLEFFTLVSHEFQRLRLEVWHTEEIARQQQQQQQQQQPAAASEATPETEPQSQLAGTDDAGEYVYSLGGLFPKPVNPAQWDALDRERVARGMPPLDTLFFLMGKLVAKALLDQRLLDMRFSDAFLRWCLGEALSLGDLRALRPRFGASLGALADMASADVDALCLDFRVPGEPEWELKSGGTETAVDASNVSEYANAVFGAVFGTGVRRQLLQFRRGFDAVLPLHCLRVFGPSELDALLCGEGGGAAAAWTHDALMDSIECDHGYSHSSQAVKDLVDVLTELPPDDRRRFVLFLTGSPKLPVGGFLALHPKFTVVCKRFDSTFIADHYLPSVNCCFYYLKLPNYSCKEVMRQKLLYTIRNGQGSFDLT